MKNIIACFVSGPALLFNATEEEEIEADELSALFQTYIWGKNGLCEIMTRLKYEPYGQDLMTILFQFYLNPIPYLLQHLKEVDVYRRNERSIGIPVVINYDNFFGESDGDRKRFLVNTVLEKLDILAEVVSTKRLDTKVDLLKEDLRKLLFECYLRE